MLKVALRYLNNVARVVQKLGLCKRNSFTKFFCTTQLINFLRTFFFQNLDMYRYNEPFHQAVLFQGSKTLVVKNKIATL